MVVVTAEDDDSNDDTVPFPGMTERLVAANKEPSPCHATPTGCRLLLLPWMPSVESYTGRTGIGMESYWLSTELLLPLLPYPLVRIRVLTMSAGVAIKVDTTPDKAPATNAV